MNVQAHFAIIKDKTFKDFSKRNHNFNAAQAQEKTVYLTAVQT